MSPTCHESSLFLRHGFTRDSLSRAGMFLAVFVRHPSLVTAPRTALPVSLAGAVPKGSATFARFVAVCLLHAAEAADHAVCPRAGSAAVATLFVADIAGVSFAAAREAQPARRALIVFTDSFVRQRRAGHQLKLL